MEAGPVTPRRLRNLLLRRSEQVGECRVWTGSCSSSGYPQFGVGKKRVSAKKTAFVLRHNRAPTQLLSNTCGNNKCINADHLVERTPAERVAIMHEQGRFHTPARKAALKRRERNLGPAEYGNHLLKYTRRSGTCLLWQGSRDSNGVPTARKGGSTRSIPRLLFEITYGRPVKTRYLVMACRKRSCINPLHFVEVDNKPRGYYDEHRRRNRRDRHKQSEGAVRVRKPDIPRR